MAEQFLVQSEQVIQEFKPISYKGVNYNCAVTNTRVLLYKTPSLQSQETRIQLSIDYRNISSISLERKGQSGVGQGIGACLALFGFICIMIGFSIGGISILGLVLLPVGICIAVVSSQSSHFILIAAGTSFELYSTSREVLEKVVNMVRNLKDKTPKEETPLQKDALIETASAEALYEESKEAYTAVASDQLVLQDEILQLKADLAFDHEVIAAKEAKIAEQTEEIAQLKDFIAKVSERVAQPQPSITSPPQVNGLCAKCGFQNVVEALYCRQCGTKLAPNR